MKIPEVNNDSWTNLNVGNGDACAGQSRLIWLLLLRVKDKLSELNDSLGLALPIGSE